MSVIQFSINLSKIALTSSIIFAYSSPLMAGWDGTIFGLENVQDETLSRLKTTCTNKVEQHLNNEKKLKRWLNRIERLNTVSEIPSENRSIKTVKHYLLDSKTQKSLLIEEVNHVSTSTRPNIKELEEEKKSLTEILKLEIESEQAVQIYNRLEEIDLKLNPFQNNNNFDNKEDTLNEEFLPLFLNQPKTTQSDVINELKNWINLAPKKKHDATTCIFTLLPKKEDDNNNN